MPGPWRHGFPGFAHYRPDADKTAGQQIVVRSRASTPFAAPRPTDRTHTDMTEARPTQPSEPTIPARPDTLTLGTSLRQRLEILTELRRKAETKRQQTNWKFTHGARKTFTNLTMKLCISVDFVSIIT